MKKILSYFSLLFVFAISINSCRTNELVENEVKQKEKIGAFVRFENKNKTYKTSEINYNVPFAELINYYLDKHPAYKTSLASNLGTIDLTMSSQTMGETEKFVLFPIRNSQNIISEVLVAKVNENRDFVQFRQLLDDEAKTIIVNAFQIAANKVNNNFKEKEVTIQEVGIIIPKVKFMNEVVLAFQPYYPPTKPDEMDGGSDDYNGGGGGEDTPDDSEKDPCENLKSTTNSDTFKANIVALEATTGQSHENGYRIGGLGQNQLLQNKPSTKEVDLSIFNTTTALMHTHYDGLYPMFTPADIIQFNKWIVWAKNYNGISTNTPKIPLNNLSLSVITSYGNYIMTFDGTDTNTFPDYTKEQIEDLNNKYEKSLKEGISIGNVSGNPSFDMEKIEEGFMKFLKKEMNMTGLKVSKIQDDGNYEMKLKPNNKIEKTKCP